jgi:hypothetical protein
VSEHARVKISGREYSSRSWESAQKAVRLLEGVEVFLDEVADAGAAEDFDEADFFGGEN